MSKIKSKIQLGVQAVFSYAPSPEAILSISWVWAIICLVGLFIVPISELSKTLRPDENALLIRSSWLYYNEQYSKIALKHVENLNKLTPTSSARIAYLQDAFNQLNIRSSTQTFNYVLPLETKPSIGTNFYGILRAPRGDGTEALVLNADWQSFNTSESNNNGVALLLSLAEIFSGASYWAKDVILLITDGGLPAYNAWLSAYHDSQPFPGISSLSLRSGAIQLAVDLDLPGLYSRYGDIQLIYGGVNGVLPNSDLMTTLVEASYMFGDVIVSDSKLEPNTYLSHLSTAARQLFRQASCAPSTPQGLFLKYDVDAITVRGVANSGESLGFYHLGQLIECTFRSLNNLLERLHHATRFYVMISPFKFTQYPVFISLTIAIGLLSIIVPVLHLRKFEKNISTEKSASSTAKLDFYLNSPAYPSLRFQSGLHGPILYLACFIVSLISERVASHGLYRLSQPLAQLGWLLLVGTSSIIASQFLCRLFKYHDDAPREAKLLALACSGLGATFLFPSNSGLSLLLGLVVLPYTLLFLPKILSPSLSVFASPFLWPIWFSAAYVISLYGVSISSDIYLEILTQLLKNIFVTWKLFGGWLVPAIFLVYMPLHLAFLLP